MMNGRIFGIALSLLAAGTVAVAQTSPKYPVALSPMPAPGVLADAETSAVAALSAPLSVLPVGMSMDYSYLTMDGNKLVLGLAPYKTPLTWSNYTTGAYSSLQWTYPDPNDKTNVLTATTKDLVAPAYPFGQFAAPVLTVDGQSVNSYAAIQYGGEVIAPVNGENTIFEAALYNYPRYVAGYLSFNTYGNGLSGVGETADAIWTSESYGGQSGKIKSVLGVGMAVPPPAVPYQTSYAYIRFTSSTLSDRSTLTCNVYSATSDMKLLATGKCKKSQTYQSESGTWRTALFSLKPVEGNSREPLLVDGPVIFVFGGDMVAGENVEFGMARDLDGYDEGKSCRGYFVFESNDGGKLLLRSNTVAFSDGSSATGLFASFDATYSWLKCDDTSFVAPTAGGEKTFSVDAYYDLCDSKITSITSSTQCDWAHVSMAAIDADGLYPMTISVDALPEGTAGRSATFTLNSKGLKKEFTVSQGEASVASISCVSKAYFSGDQLVVESTANSASVYSVSGEKVAESELDGATAVPAAWASGVYIVRFSNGDVQKIVKR